MPLSLQLPSKGDPLYILGLLQDAVQGDKEDYCYILKAPLKEAFNGGRGNPPTDYANARFVDNSLNIAIEKKSNNKEILVSLANKITSGLQDSVPQYFQKKIADEEKQYTESTNTETNLTKSWIKILNDADFASVKSLSLDLEICIIYVVFEDNVNLRITGKLVSGK